MIIQRSDLKTRPIPPAPDTFNDLRSVYVAQCLDPLLSDVSEVDRLHHLLARYVESPSAPLLVRKVTGMELGTVCQTRAGALKATDNAPPSWWHSILFNRVRVDSNNLGCLIEGTPWHFFQMSKWTTVNGSRWHAAHIFDVRDRDTDWRGWSRESAVRRFIRNIHPCNVFFVPLIEWRRVGADPDLIAAVAAHYRRRHASVWMEFLRLAQGEPQLGDGAVDGPLVIDASRAAAVPTGNLYREIDAIDSRVITLTGRALDTPAPKYVTSFEAIQGAITEAETNGTPLKVGSIVGVRRGIGVARSYVASLAVKGMIELDGLTGVNSPRRPAKGNPKP
jgi:hypothetical protein